MNGTNTVNVTTSGFSLTGANASLSNNFTLGSTTFSAANLTGSYTSSTNTFAVTGQSSATVSGLGNLVVNLGNSAVGSAGLVVTNGTLQSFDAGITGNLSVAGASFSTNNLILTENTTTNIFTISGGSNFTANGIGNVSVYFGGANSTGLVLTNGSLTSVNATLNSNLAACRQSAAFRIHTSRGADGLKALLDSKIHGMVSSDRWGAYNKLPLEQRQICWSHLGRDFQKHFERGGDAKEVGETGLEVHSCLFSDWNEFRDGKIDRSVLIQRMDQISTELRTQLETGSRSPDKKTRTFCRKLLKIYPALWNFSRIPEVEPTNNFAERTVRGAVIWRKCSYGHHSQLGERFVERMLSVVTTLKLRNQNVLDYLYESVKSYRQNQICLQMTNQL